MTKLYRPVGGKTLWPLGSIYMSVKNVNPSKYFGGTWVAWGTGRVPVGVDTNQTEFNTVEKTGGSKYIQDHKHIYTNKHGNVSNGVHFPAMSNMDNKYAPTTLLLKTQGVADITTGNSGNIQPYITCYMWKRTA